MGKIERRAGRLIAMLRISGKADIATVVSKLGVSEATARRLFAYLEGQGKLIRTHGGVRISPETDYGYSFSASATRKASEKTAIGHAAAATVSDGESIFLDSGTTILRLAQALSERIQSGELKGLRIVTNSLANTDILCGHCKVILLGGEVRRERRDTCGRIAEINISQYHFDKAFLGTDGVTAEAGFMASDELTAEICRVAISHSEKTCILADSEKFGRKSFVAYLPLGEVDCVFTDRSPEGAMLKALAGKRVKIDVSGSRKSFSGGKIKI